MSVGRMFFGQKVWSRVCALVFVLFLLSLGFATTGFLPLCISGVPVAFVRINFVRTILTNVTTIFVRTSLLELCMLEKGLLDKFC
jgi:hypothetical protein